jgi:ssDNA-binding Zn-finger/Zn-ribbon topoisomerase 1
MKVHGLKCDNPSCDYKDDSIERSEYPRYIDYPCPKCGCSLLTIEDYKALVELEKLDNNPIIKFISWIKRDLGCKVEFHGNGFENMEVTINTKE